MSGKPRLVPLVTSRPVELKSSGILIASVKLIILLPFNERYRLESGPFFFYWQKTSSQADYSSENDYSPKVIAFHQVKEHPGIL